MNPASLLVLLILCAATWPSVVAGPLSVVAGTGERGSDGDGGPALKARLDNPFGVVRGPDGALWFADYGAHRVRRIDRAGIVTTVVGNGKAAFAGDGGPAAAASLNRPHELRFDAGGRLHIADTGNHVIRRYDPATGLITTVAGTGQAGNDGDAGPAVAARLREPISLQFAANGDLYIADVSSHVLRRVDGRTGLISTFAGTGRPGRTPDDAPVPGTPLQGPRSLDFDAAGGLWLVTREGNQVFRLDPGESRIRRVAGTGAKGFTGDGGPALVATFSGPKGIAVAPDGAVYLADTENHAIRRIDRGLDRIGLVAGTGVEGEAGDPPPDDPTSTRLARPHGVFVDADGTVYIGDSERHRILALRPPAGGARP